MNINSYLQFLSFQEKGMKQQATNAINEFISSFTDDEEKKKWTFEYLPELHFNRNARIRHELFKEIVFPVLFSGYKAKDLQSMIWLAKLCQNYYQCKSIHAKLDFKTDHQIYMECYKIDPNNSKVIDGLLAVQIDWFQYSEHEWPSGILYGIGGATIEECEKIKDAIIFSRKLDNKKIYTDFLNSYEDKLLQYIQRLKKNTESI